MSKNITIYEIAKEAGVSVSTVSRVLTGNVKVSAGRQKRILEIIKKYDYRPNSMARSLSNQKTRTIGVVLPDITHPFFNHIFYSAEAQAMEMGYTLLLGCTMNDTIRHATNLETTYIKMFKQKQVDGMLLMGGLVNEAVPIDEHTKLVSWLNGIIPVITIDDAMKERETYHINIDDVGGTEAMVNYMVSLKHRHFAYLGGDMGIQPTPRRVNSLIGCLTFHGITFNMDYFIPSGFDVESGITAMTQLLQKPKLPTAVLCLNDLVAIGAIYTAQKAGIRIPQDMSISGSDNMPMSEYITPSITTIDLKANIMGKKAVEVLVNVIEGKKQPQNTEIITELVIRDSCRTHVS